LLISLIISLTINLWISYFSSKDITEKDKTKKHKNSKYDIRKYYLVFMKKFLNEDKKSIKNRKVFKITFWITLLLVIFSPIYFDIFKARMLPKSDQNQIYIWID
jgi:multidrug efflux pump subunit AcrB